MKKLVITAVLALTALALPAAASASEVTRPHKGTDVGTVVVEEVCDLSGFPVVVCDISTEGTGNMTHLGRVSTSSTGTISIDLFAAPCELPGGLPGQSILGSGTFVYTAANGDEVHGSYENTICSPAEGAGTLQGSQTITGGTGRFEGASGATVYDGTADDPEPGTFALAFVGTITF